MGMVTEIPGPDLSNPPPALLRRFIGWMLAITLALAALNAITYVVAGGFVSLASAVASAGVGVLLWRTHQRARSDQPEGKALLHLIAGSCVTAVGAALVTELIAPPLTVSPLHTAALRVGGVGVSVTLVALILWQLSVWLHTTFRRLQDTNRALHASRAQLQALIEHMPVMVDAFDAEGRVVLWNRECERVTGYRADEIVGNPDALALLYPDASYRERMLREWKRGAPFRDLHWNVTCKDGSERTIAWSCVAQRVPIQGLAHWAVGIDVTERARAEEALQRRERELNAIVSNSPDIINRVDRELRHLFISPAVERTLGMPQSAFIGKTNRELGLPEENVALIERACREVIASGQPRTVESEWTTPDGPRWYESRILPEFAPDGAVETLLLLTRDVTEQRRAEEQRRLLDAEVRNRQKLESLSVLAGGVAHDFNNMLGIILGNAELALLDLPPTHPAYSSIEMIINSVRRAGELTRQMMVFAGRRPLVTDALNLNVLLDEMRPELQSRMPTWVALNYRLCYELPPIKGDAAQLHQLIGDLVSNAVEAIGDKDGAITITTSICHADRELLAGTFLAPDLPEGDYAALEVADTGPGMDAEMRDKIFEPFYTTKFVGRGMGLPAVLGIVQAHSGAVKIESEPGRGTAVTVLLPTSAPEDVAAA